MLSRGFPFAALLLAALLAAGCQSTPPATYRQLHDKVVDGEPVSVAALRDAFRRDVALPRMMERLVDLEQQALQLVEDEPLKLGSIGSAILDTYQASITGHYVLTRFYTHVEAPEAAARHEAWLARIAEDMESLGDGSRERPYPVMTSVEAQMYVLYRDLSPVGAIYISSEEQPFGLLIQAKPDQGAIRNLAFDLGAVYEAMRMDFASSTDSDGEFSPFSVIGYLAKRGDSAAQAAIGAFLMARGRPDEAVDWLEAAARSGNLVASSALAGLYWEKARSAEDDQAKQAALDQVLDHHLHAIALGSTDSMYALGVLYLNGTFGEENRTSGITLLKQAADAAHPEANLFLAHLHYTGEIDEVSKDLAAAARYYVRAAELGDARARRNYARFLLDREVDVAVDERVISWLEELADAGDAEAMLLLGNLHARGIGTAQSHRRAVRWYRRAVDAAPENARVVNEVAWILTVSHLPELRRVRYARQIMDTMMEANPEARGRPEYLDTWAATYAAIGEFDRAQEIQEQALNVAQKMELESVLAILEEHLHAFQNGETITETAP